MKFTGTDFRPDDVYADPPVHVIGGAETGDLRPCPAAFVLRSN